MTTRVPIRYGGTGANTAADARDALGVSSSTTTNAAYAQANSAANTVRVSQNSASTLSAKQLNFVNTANVTIIVTDSGNGNANIQFDVAAGGGGTLSNIAISSNGIFATNANSFNFVNTATVSVTVQSGVNGNANISFAAEGTTTTFTKQTFSSANASGNLVYALNQTPLYENAVFVNKNGVALIPGTEFTLSGNTITVIETGEANDTIDVRYLVDSSIVPPNNTIIIVQANTPASQTSTFTLSHNVTSINLLTVSKNGLRLTPNSHYTLNGNTVTLASVAEANDNILFEYFYDLGSIQFKLGFDRSSFVGDGNTINFQLNTAPSNEDNCLVFVDRVLQRNSEYNVTASTLTFAGAPDANAVIDVFVTTQVAANNGVLKIGDTMTGNLNVAATLITQNVEPATNITYNLGTSTKRFKDLWLSNSTIYLGDATISANGNSLVVPSIQTSSGVNVEAQVANSYNQANAAYGQANSAYGQANAAYGQANAAYGQANLAYTAANNSNLLSGGLITGTLNVTQDIIVSGNIYLEGNTTFINVATYSVEDPLIYLASNNKLTDSVDIGFMGGKNTSGTYSHTGFARDATDGKWKLFDGLADEGHVGNVIDFANTRLATIVANVEANTLTVVNGVSGNVNFDSGTLFIDSVGNRIGVGTTSPGAKFQVNSTSAPDLMVRFGPNSDFALDSKLIAPSSNLNSVLFQEGLVYFGGNFAASIGYGRGTGADDGFLTFGTNNAERMRLASDGNLGIGTNSPNYQLHITNNIAVGASGFNQQLLLSNNSIQSQILGVGYSTLRLNSLGAGVLCGSTVSVGGATPAASGAGVTFPATQSASSDVNTLDDYEEGTWTPNVGGNTTYYQQQGFYTKIGKVVFIRGWMHINAIGTGRAQYISGLPFSSQDESTIPVDKSQNLSVAVTWISLRTAGLDLYATFRLAADSSSTINPNFMTTSTEIQFSGCYYVA